MPPKDSRGGIITKCRAIDLQAAGVLIGDKPGQGKHGTINLNVGRALGFSTALMADDSAAPCFKDDEGEIGHKDEDGSDEEDWRSRGRALARRLSGQVPRGRA